VPAPFAWLVGFVAVGYILARLLGAHAGWVGRRWARGVRASIGRAVTAQLEAEALAPIDAFEAARQRAWTLAATIIGGCGR
jgi:hypothetical protein